MSIALITRGMVCFGSTTVVTAGPCVESSMSVVEETNVPSITSITDLKPSITPGVADSAPSINPGAADTEVRPRIVRVRDVKPKIV